jgi:hypothetical protein
MRRFILYRKEDVSGVSGTGRVVEGIAFTDGRCAYRWCVKDKPNTTTLADCIEDIEVIHGHDGLTEFQWIDPPEEDGVR